MLSSWQAKLKSSVSIKSAEWAKMGGEGGGKALILADSAVRGRSWVDVYAADEINETAEL